MRLHGRLFAVAILSSTAVLGQTLPGLNKGDRPVFMPAHRLAGVCEDWGSVNPGGKPPKANDVLTVTHQQITRAGICDAYILGMFDQLLEPGFGAKYRPVRSNIPDMKLLIDTFFKYMKDHPEEQNLAASTVLGKVGLIIADMQKGSTSTGQ